MEARGMGAHPQRTSIVEIELMPIDWIIMIGALLAIAVGLVMRFKGIGVLVKGYL
jgi:energy-coupling factor transporter transmembrane protein EcfT